MAVIYLFDSAKQLRRPVHKGVQEIIHTEGEYAAVTQIIDKDAPQNGEYFGFHCMDGRFRLFLIHTADVDDESSTCMLTGTDAAIAELENSVVTELSLQNTTAVQAITGALQGTDWVIGQQTGDGQVNTESAYFATRWAAIKTAAAAGGVRAVPYYEFSGNRITAKKVDVLDKTPVFSGLIYTRRRGAQNIHITREGVPYGRVYPVGKIIGDGEPPEQVTIADAVWSMANGDQADKPAGQLYIDLPGADTSAEYVFEDKREEDPTRLMEKAFRDLQSTGKPTASGTANLNEMQHMPGYEHMTAQMWELAVICAESGEMVETTIINIDRYYVHTELTKITVGDENSNADALENMLADMQSALIEAAKVAGGGRAGAGKAKVMVLEAEELIRLNSEKIEANAEQITLRALDADVQQLEDLTFVAFQEVYLDLDTTRALISATDQKVDNINNQVTGLASELTVQADQIKQRAYQYEVDELGNRVATAESELLVQAGQISAKVSVDGVINAINLSKEGALIQADRINLVGYVTMSSFEAEMATIDNIFAGYSEISGLGISGNLYAQNANFPGNVSLLGRVTNMVDVTMGSVASHILYGAGNGKSMDLQHSHTVTVDDNGRVHLGEVSSSGGSFNVADTKAYKDGVSAAYDRGYTQGYNSVSISQGEWESNNTKRVTATNRQYLIVDASGIYGNGYNAGHEAGKNAYAPTAIRRTGYSTTYRTVTVKASNAYQDLLTGISIDASEIWSAGHTAGVADGYEDGVMDGWDNGYEAAKDDVVVGYSNLAAEKLSSYSVKITGTVWANVDGVRVASAKISRTLSL